MKRLVQNKKALSMALAAALAIAPVSAFAASNDIRGHWAERTITQWQDKGLIGGYQDGTFKPDKPATRAEFARIMN
ncbi:MAG: S-layer homology domain-containing protein [Anaerotignum propionicum]|nr:S-layer homology domain-containing protein [Anaerotignum propionicum]MEA5057934.1 S-layer homology domain-containing protein [Anaerotignum propionicum]